MSIGNHLNIRIATAADRDIVYELVCGLEDTRLDSQGFDLAFNTNVQNPLIRYFLASYQNEPAGMISCHIQPLLHHAAFVAEIQEMYVEPHLRSQGIGNALMREAVAFAKAKGAVQIEVTSRKVREKAHQFYQREGFENSHVKLVRYFNK